MTESISESKSELEIRMINAIKESKFNFFEITGFKMKPELALLDGVAIGYKMALDDYFLKEVKP